MTDYFADARAALDNARKLAGDTIKQNAKTLLFSVGGPKAVQVARALVTDQAPIKRRPQAPINHPLVEQRKRQMDREMSEYMAAAAASGAPEAAYGAWPAEAGRWLARVWPHSEWDDKNLRQPQDRTLERQGNYSYGATAQHLGLPEEIALRGAGLAQRWSNVFNAKDGRDLTARQGQPFYFGGAYGDDPLDQRDIQDAYRDGRR